MDSFRSTLWMMVIIASITSGLLGWLVAYRGLAPLRQISRDVERITAHRLNHRLPADSIPFELAEVAHTLNDMLARLQEAFRRISEFSSDIAHELRTPLSNLLTQTQVTLSKERSVAVYEDVLASNAEELERLSRTISDMLFLAKAENQLIIPNRESLNLRDEAESLLEFYEALADERNIKLLVEGQAIVMGDRLMLRRAIGNLLSNAFRHTPDYGAISIRIATHGRETTTLTVENTGDAIPDEILPRLFDRFYCADPSRQYTGEGAGLGLAITRSIMLAHDGEISAKSDHGLVTFELRLPLRDPETTRQKTSSGRIDLTQ